VFHAGQFYVHIFQLNYSFPITSVWSKFAVQIPRWFGHFTFLPLARINWAV
jgi:hypothetical protein